MRTKIHHHADHRRAAAPRAFHAVDTNRRQRALDMQRTDPAGFARDTLLETFALARIGQEPSRDLAARIGVLIDSTASARAALTALAAYPSAWRYTCALAEHVGGSARAHLLTLAGLVAYRRGNLAAAREALAAARAESAPAAPPLLRLLTAALEVSLPPSHVEPISESGSRTLDSRFGIALAMPAAA